MATSMFSTIDGDIQAPARPEPKTDGERYLVALLDSQAALEAALAALSARAAHADAEETEFIRVRKGSIEADYLKLDAMVTAYLSQKIIFKTISDKQLTDIRAVLDRLQASTATKDKASAIVKAVTELLRQWDA